jgi:allophanate hydrolase subunit 2
MLVAMPTAIPVEPFIRSCGRRLGRTIGSSSVGVVVRAPLDRVGAEVGEHLLGDRRQACLGVAVGGRRVAVERAEVALAVHQRVAQREVLGHAHHGVVRRGVAVRVVLADHLADDLRRLPRLAPASRRRFWNIA